MISVDRGGHLLSGTVEDIALQAMASLVDREYGTRIGGRATLLVEARSGPNGWEIGKLSASVPRLSASRVLIEKVSAEGSLGAPSGSFSLVPASPRVMASADIRREGWWPVSFSVRAEGIPTGSLLDAIGRKEAAAGGAGGAGAEGTA